VSPVRFRPSPSPRFDRFAFLSLSQRSGFAGSRPPDGAALWAAPALSVAAADVAAADVA
jgi:hypothetical protein